MAQDYIQRKDLRDEPMTKTRMKHTSFRVNYSRYAHKSAVEHKTEKENFKKEILPPKYLTVWGEFKYEGNEPLSDYQIAHLKAGTPFFKLPQVSKSEALNDISEEEYNKGDRVYAKSTSKYGVVYIRRANGTSEMNFEVE